MPEIEFSCNQEQKKEYSSIYSRYVDYYHNELLKNEAYSNARDYLKNRSLGKEIVKKFKIGFVDYNFLKANFPGDYFLSDN